MKVLYFASLRERAGRSESMETIDPGTTVADLWESIRSRPEFASAPSAPGFAVNGVWCDGRRVLAAGDSLGLLPPVSGG